jgi:small subunit ribosomal protein S20
MPIIASAKKRNRQNKPRRVRNHATLANMRSLFKNIIKAAEKGDSETALKYFSDAQSAIDTCVKKNLIHANNGARKKARIARALNKITGEGEVKVEKKTKLKA